MSSCYIALLRGINVGGHKKIKMADLRDLFEALGYENVKTVLASGNIAWDSDSDDRSHMRDTIEKAIEERYGFTVPTQVILKANITALIGGDPFAGIEVTKATRRYVTFLPEPVATNLVMPYESDTGDFTILSVTDTCVCSVLTVTNTRSVDAMKILEQEFGKGITTRNWNTVLKLANL